MVQKNIRRHNGTTFTVAEAAGWLKELDDRTKSSQSGYNSIDELADESKKSVKKLNGIFTVGGNENNFYPVVFSTTENRLGNIRIYRGNVHENGTWRGAMNLQLDNISVSDTGHINNNLSMHYNYLRGSLNGPPFNLCKWVCLNNLGSEVVVYLLGGTTYRYEALHTTVVDLNPNGEDYTYSGQRASITPVANDSPSVTPGFRVFNTPNTTGFFSNQLYSKAIVVDGNITCRGLIETSDKKSKSNIGPIDGEWALGVFKKLRFSFYDFSRTNSKRAGLIAQEVEKLLPEAVHTSENGEKGLDHTYIDMVCKAGIQHFIKTQIQ